MTKEQEKISARNKARTRKQLNVSKGYVMHHKDPNMKVNDPDRYILGLPEDLEIMKKEEHVAFHGTLNKASRCKKISKARKNYKTPEHQRMMQSIHHAGKYAPELTEEEAIERYYARQKEKEEYSKQQIEKAKCKAKWASFKSDKRKEYIYIQEQINNYKYKLMYSTEEDRPEIERHLKFLRSEKKKARELSAIGFKDFINSHYLALYLG